MLGQRPKVCSNRNSTLCRNPADSHFQNVEIRLSKGITPEKKTFRAELGRSLGIGVTETALVTFAALIAIRVYDSSPTVKALIFASIGFGLIGSLFTLPVVARLRWRLTHAAAGITAIGAVGLLIAALGSSYEFLFITGVCLTAATSSLAIPLQAQWHRQHYPDARRGRLFASTNLLRAIVTMVTGWLGGKWLAQDITNFQPLFIIFAGFAFFGAACLLGVPEPTLATRSGRSATEPRIFHALHWLRDDKVFFQVLMSAMAIGIGVHIVNALRVDFVANPEFGLSYDEETVALLTATLPAAVRAISTFFWGWLYDRIDLYWMRVGINGLFALAILLYFLGGNLAMITVGAALFGLARGGGEIMWNLWVTQLAKPEHAGEYMSVHTCFTGLRALIAPFVGFAIATHFSIGGMIGVSMFFVFISIALLVPLLKKSASR